MENINKQREVMVEAFTEVTRSINDLVVRQHYPQEIVCDLADIMQDAFFHALDRMEHLERAAEAERTAESATFHVVFAGILGRLKGDDPWGP